MNLYYSLKSTILILVTSVFAVVISSVLDGELSSKEQTALERFKESVIPKIPESSYFSNYVNDDLFFLRWLRATSFDRQAAQRRLMDSLKWRKSENIDEIDEEDWSCFEKEFPLFVDTEDKDGRPSTELLFGEWNVRGALHQGIRQKLLRWATRMMEMNMRRLFKTREMGLNVTQVTFLTQLRGFSVVQQGCPRCLAYYTDIVRMCETHYPLQFGSVIFVNTPPSFQVVLRAVLPIMGTYTRNAVQTYSTGWESTLDTMFHHWEISPTFGGTKTRSLEEGDKLCEFQNASAPPFGIAQRWVSYIMNAIRAKWQFVRTRFGLQRGRYIEYQ